MTTDHQSQPDRHESILDLIGNTPIVRITTLNTADNVTIYGKLEGMNPGGSVKDRIALSMIEAAERTGDLAPGKIIIEATSGNTGIGLALVAAAKGYRIILAMSEAASEERKKILKALGAELLLTPAHLGTDGAIEMVYEMVRQKPDSYFAPDQFNNENNVLAHYHGTAEEIWRQTGGMVTVVVGTLGTSGTMMGISRRLKEYNPAIRIIGVEPFLNHRIQGLKNMKESYRPGIFDRSALDETVNVTDEDAFAMARKLAVVEGIMAGMSSGAAMHVALEKARTLREGVMVVILPDNAERYLSTELFADKEETTLALFNTAGRAKEFFKPISPDRVLMHSCGPSVHDVPHIGTHRRFVIGDMLARYLALKGLTVHHEINIIDMADNSVAKAGEAGMNLESYTDQHVRSFLRDMNTLNMSDDILYPRASRNVDAMIDLTQKLVEKGYAYEKLRSVYFDISRLENYGRLSGIDLGRVRHRKTIDDDDYEKDSPVDFTLFKRSTLDELKRGIFFKTRWGSVRPGWHLECAAISRKHLGETFDIHLSGTDIIFPHCENVMAIGMAANGSSPARFWLNAELVMRDGKKMSRSLSNTFTVEDLLARGYGGKEIRYFLLSSHYRKPLNFSFESLDTAAGSVRRINNFIQRLQERAPGKGSGDIYQQVYDARQAFMSLMDDDLNISGALATLFTFIKSVNKPLSEGTLDEGEGNAVLDVMKVIDAVLGIMNFETHRPGADIDDLMAARSRARARGDWSEADRIRDELAGRGILLHDTADGTRWTLKN
ncbi:MAG: cysteine--tRNA ligase [Syntrophales bacterium]|jgi:cysteinyl-tRNA synthetase|nr:cysteine--tRNA ligase [Syntrophales bacterium]MCK9527062.1 cysteine--tRNA ligase [Syntrophales bacterium]MDX9921813.1 cysteine--tRNA ligase [Syntrophales bacterium]